MRDSATVSRRRALVAWCTVALAAAAAAGCDDGDGGSTEGFCADLREHADELMNPAISTQADVEAYLALHDTLGEDVPLAIEEEWADYAGALQLAAAVVPGDPGSVDEARAAIYAAEESAIRVKDWVSTNCELDLASAGPVARYDPAVTTTTVAPPTTG